ncbi:biliverdin-producing heme oxygenase [Actinotalea sp. C106]|uniref:biliverdin-producing heme oxygenase n=1 Tax=Actinotalea sp. C106 TaxID=2908644 RepID=UPI002028E90E|nr:biliverdin-producing heme oxygenase [Actinotalea sp. C106]
MTLSVLLREATREQHERAESMPFVGDLVGGRLDVAAYADLQAQLHRVYTALEDAGRRVGATAVGQGMVVDSLLRVPALEADLAHLLGPRWRHQVRLLPATERYAARLDALTRDDVGLFAAHAYTRYLGDLSGGQSIRVAVGREYAVGEEGLGFYRFRDIPKPKLFKDEYRGRLDALPLDGAATEVVLAEARLAFDLNTDLFADLGGVHRPALSPAAAPRP